MIVRKFTGRTMTEALALVEREIGKDALIVDSTTSEGVATIFVRRDETERTPRKRRKKVSKGKTAKRVKFRSGFLPLAARLQKAGLPRSLLVTLQRALTGLDPHLLDGHSPALVPVLRRVLAGLIRTHKLERSRVVALVGPTGVGKTTTLAKLAARDTLRQKDVAIVTTDTFRIAAVEQLRAFAEMMDVPFRVAFTPQDLRAAIDEHHDRDRIYIDTSGRSPGDVDSLHAMRGFFRGIAADVQLCIPAACRRADLEHVYTAFGGFEPTGLVVTKWDETRVRGETLAFAIERDVPISFIADGQRVPEDGWRADAGRITDCLLEER